MLTLVALLVAASCAVAFWNWRWGIAAAILMGLIQDPLRKMVPGVPGYLAMASAPVWLSAMAAAALSGELRVRHFLRAFPRLARWCLIFAVYLSIPAAISATRGANTWQITLLGAFVYSATYFALIAGWRFANHRIPTTRLLAFYALCAAALLVGGPLEYWGWTERIPALGTEMLGNIWVTYRTGEAVFMLAGFFRGPDVMGWHATLLFMVAVMLAIRARGWRRGLWIALAVWGLICLWLCGRRKMLSMIPVFAGCYLLLIFRFRGIRRLALAVSLTLLIAGMGWYGIARLYPDSAVETFYLTTFDEYGDQLWQHSYATVQGTLGQAGFWGYGLGMSQQGIHHIQADKPNVWQESGPGKMLAELGAPGALLFLTIGVVLLRTAYQVIRRSADRTAFYLHAGLFAILIANVSAALVSAQIYGDPFIAILLAFLAGLLLGGARNPVRPADPLGPPDEVPAPSPGETVCPP